MFHSNPPAPETNATTPDPNTPPPPGADGQTFCAVHTNVEATLRCNKCGRIMCSRCSVPTPVGYRCRECVYQQQDAFFTATQFDSLLAFGIAAVISIPLSAIFSQLGLFIALILSIPAGGAISEIVLRVTKHRRARNTWILVTAGIVVGALIGVLVFDSNVRLAIEIMAGLNTPDSAGLDPQGQQALNYMMAQFSSVIGQILLTPVLYTVLCAGAAAVRLRSK